MTSATPPGELERQWAEHLGAGGRHDAALSPRLLARARRWNTGSIVGAVLASIVVVVLLAVVVGSGYGHVSFLVVGGLFLLAMVFTVRKALRLRHRNLRRAAVDGTTVSVGADGIALPRIRSLPWSAVRGVILYDDSARNRAQRSVPIAGWGAAMAMNGGDGSIAATLAFHDGEAVRALVQPPEDAKLVRLWSKDSSGRTPGDLTLTLDVVMEPDEVARLGAALSGAAALHGVPVYRPNSTGEYALLIGKVVEGRV